jgi:hypothetical protein
VVGVAVVVVVVAVFLPLHATPPTHDLYGTEATAHFLTPAAAGLVSGTLVAAWLWLRRSR